MGPAGRSGRFRDHLWTCDRRGGCQDMARIAGNKGLVIVVLVMLLGVGCARRASQPPVSAPAPEATGPSAEELRAREEAERRRRIAESELASRQTTITPGASILDTV